VHILRWSICSVASCSSHDRPVDAARKAKGSSTMTTQCFGHPKTRQSRPSYAQNWNRHRANDCVAANPQITAIRIAGCHQQIRLRLLRSLVQHRGHVTTTDEYVGLGAQMLLQFCDSMGSVADEFIFPLFIDVLPARSPKLHRSSDVGECKASGKF